jgi:HAD superfamily hydrolase (TIGR01484 family)
MSGASFPQFEKQFLAFLPTESNLSNLYLFPTNAAKCLVYKDNKWSEMYNYSFTIEEREMIIKALNKVVKNKIIENEGNYGEKIEDRGAQVTWSALGQEAPLPLKAQWDPDHEKRESMREELTSLIPEFEINIGGATSIDITRKDISKKSGVLWLSKHLALGPNEILYVGDALFPGGNDNVVKETGINTKQVSGPVDTLTVIEDLLKYS